MTKSPGSGRRACWHKRPCAGEECLAVVTTIGEGGERFSVGDAVYAMVRFPGGLAGGSMAYAEYVSVPVSDLAHKPAGISHGAAAGAPMSLLTAWQFMIELGHDAPNPLQPMRHEPVPLVGKTVLVNGAAGGVGHFTVQLAKWKGAQVIAVASARHEVLLRELGAHQIIDYRLSAPEDVVRDVDLVVHCGSSRDGSFPTWALEAAIVPGDQASPRHLLVGGALIAIRRSSRQNCGREVAHDR